MSKAFICGCEGVRLSQVERSFFARERPWGLILFSRNCDAPDQIKTLICDFRAAVGVDNAPVLIDQEGGRVQRLCGPHWHSYPPARRFARAYREDTVGGLAKARNIARLMADDLLELGINVNCMPVLDVLDEDAHDIIGDRAYGGAPETISAIGAQICKGILEGGVLPVIKHIPGHGRAREDSHLCLPVVTARREELRKTDFRPFMALNRMPLAMMAHIVYTAYDDLRVATQSPLIIEDVIRGEIGFDGLLMSDDLSMGALAGDLCERAGLSLQAGCDMILHCNGNMSEMEAVGAAAPILSGKALGRAERALQQLKPAAAFDRSAAMADLKALMA